MKPNMSASPPPAPPSFVASVFQPPQFGAANTSDDFTGTRIAGLSPASTNGSAKELQTPLSTDSSQSNIFN